MIEASRRVNDRRAGPGLAGPCYGFVTGVSPQRWMAVRWCTPPARWGSPDSSTSPTSPARRTTGRSTRAANRRQSTCSGNALALVGVNTSPSFAAPSGKLVVIDVAMRTISREIPLGGQPGTMRISPDRRYSAIAIESGRNEGVSDGELPQLPAGHLAIIDLVGGSPAVWMLLDGNTDAPMSTDGTRTVGVSGTIAINAGRTGGPAARQPHAVDSIPSHDVSRPILPQGAARCTGFASPWRVGSQGRPPGRVLDGDSWARAREPGARRVALDRAASLERLAGARSELLHQRLRLGRRRHLLEHRRCANGHGWQVAPSSKFRWKWLFLFSTEPKRGICVTSPQWPIVR
jgi:hypothetical protein